MSVTDAVAVVTVVTGFAVAVAAFFRLRAEGVFVKPSVIIDLQKSNESLSRRLDEETEKRRGLERTAANDNQRISSLEHNEQMNSHRMREMEIAQGKLKEDLRQKNIYIQELLAGIEKLTVQITKHDSKPDWRPKDK